MLFDEIAANTNVCDVYSFSFKYKSSLTGNVADDGADGKKEKAKIAVPLKYLINFWKSLEMSLIICKVELPLTWIENCVLSGAENIKNAWVVANAGTVASFKITDVKLYVAVVTLWTEDSVKLSKLLSAGVKSPVYWNTYKVIDDKIVEITDDDAEKHIRELLGLINEGVRRLFVLPYNITIGNDQVSFDSHQKYLFPRVKIENYKIETDGRNFYDQSINDSIKQYDEVRKVSTGQADDYTIGCLLDFANFKRK